MKSKEFIKEDQSIREMLEPFDGLSDKDRDELSLTLQHIKAECQPYLNEIYDPFSLYRGIQLNNLTIKRKVRLENRKPMSTPQRVHDAFNQVLTKKFGAPFRNALFVSGNPGQALNYGMVYYIFPIGEYQYLWSSEVRDLFNEYDNFRIKNPSVSDFIKSINWDSFRTDGLNDAVDVKRGAEIMLRCDSFYGINTNKIKSYAYNIPLLNTMEDYLMS